MTTTDPVPAHRFGRPRIPVRGLVGVTIAAVAIAAFYLSGTAAVTDDGLQALGFDPDRATLLSALIASAMAASIVALVGAPTALAVAAGCIAGGLGFGRIALLETRSALAASSIQGTFDPIGWLVSIGTFIAAFAVAGWAAAVVARAIRQPVLGAAATILRRVRGHDRSIDNAGLMKASGVLVSLIVVAAALPTFGDMLNFEPDAHMHHDPVGAPASSIGPTSLATPGVSQDPGQAGSPGGPSASGTLPPASTYPPGLVPGPVPASVITPGAVSVARPWASTPQTGHGRVASVELPAPWTGGIRTTISVEMYLPPGYDGGSARYPVIYTAPEPFHYWDKGVQLASLLDAMITDGSIPPMIVVFVSAFGGPYPDSECADSFDGRQWIDRFVATDLVEWMDTNLRTIATPAARATLGFSQGAYCAGAFVAHHPDVFASAMILSGYFLSGMHSGTTPVAWRPFNNDPSVMAAASPMNVIPLISATLRKGLFYAIVADPENPVYGGQMKQFAAVLHDAGVAFALIPTALGHSWQAARDFLPTLLELTAGRMVSLGVFGSGG